MCIYIYIYICTRYIYIYIYILYPPTPADARGSAPGNKTFSADHLEACNSNSNSSSSSTLLCHGVFPSGTYVFAAASGRSSWQAAAEQPAVKKQVAGSQLSAARTQQTATATAAAAVLFFGCKLWEPSGQQQAAAGSGRQPAKRWCFAVLYCASLRAVERVSEIGRDGKLVPGDFQLWVGDNFGASPSFRAMVFCCRELLFSMVFSYLGTGCKGS